MTEQLPPAARAEATRRLSGWRCRHCDAVARMIEGAGGRPLLEVWHEAGCPDHVDEDTCLPTFGVDGSATSPDFGGDAA